MISKLWVICAVLASMMLAEQYLSWDRVMARSTASGFKSLPVTMKWKLILVNTFGSVSAAVVLLLWMYNSAQILVLGAAFNAALEREDSVPQTAVPVL